MNLEAAGVRADPTTLVREFRERGFAAVIIAMPEGFTPREVEVVFLQVGPACEVFIPADVGYAGRVASWQTLMAKAALPGNARHVVTVSGDWVDGLAAFLDQRDWPAVENDGNAEEASALLGIKLPASREEIRAAFRRLAKVHHPDRLAGALPAERANAESRMTALISAYRRLTGTQTSVPH